MSKNRNFNNSGKDNKHKSYNRNSRGKHSRGREIEMNVPYSSLNKEEIPHVITSAKTNNDPSWYTHIYPLVKDVGSLAFNNILGLTYNPINKPVTSEGTTTGIVSTTKIANNHQIPGIMTLHVSPIMGISNSPTSAANIAAQQIYTLDRKANSGATNYDKTDLMMMLLGMDSAYMLYEYLLRAYKLFASYDYMNRYMPNLLLRALGFDPGLGNSLADFRALINNFAYKLASINVPDQFDFIHRHSWLFTNIYQDSNSPKAQMFAFVPDLLYVYTEGQNDAPTKLTRRTIQQIFGMSNPNDYIHIDSLDQIQTAIDTIMNPLLGSQDVGTISGDLAKAFGEGGMIKIMPIEDLPILRPVYDREVALQIMNAVIEPASPTDITVELGDLVSGPYLKQNVNYSSGGSQRAVSFGIKKMLNFIDTENTPENVFVSTRFMPTAMPNTGSMNTFVCTSAGTEVLSGAKIWFTQSLTSVPDGPISDIPVSIDIRSSIVMPTALTSQTVNTMLQQLISLSNFDWAPTTYIFEQVDGGESGYNNLYEFLGYFQDVSTYQILEDTTIQNLNEVAIMSEYAVKDYSTALTK